MQALNACCCLLTLLVATAQLVAGQIPDVVIPLDNSNFEHDTQASTGQTTGAWFVLFNARHLPRQQQVAHALWAELAKDEEKDVILAEVDLGLEANKQLAWQFKDLQPPEAVLFRDQLMYVYPGSLLDEDSAEKVRAFWQGGYLLHQGKPVPTTKRKPVTKDDLEASGKLDGKQVVVGIVLLAMGMYMRRRLAATQQAAAARTQPASSAAAAATAGNKKKS